MQSSSELRGIEKRQPRVHDLEEDLYKVKREPVTRNASKQVINRVETRVMPLRGHNEMTRRTRCGSSLLLIDARERPIQRMPPASGSPICWRIRSYGGRRGWGIIGIRRKARAAGREGRRWARDANLDSGGENMKASKSRVCVSVVIGCVRERGPGWENWREGC